jgi:hypothetical protein
MSAPAVSRRSDWWIPALLILLSLVPAIAGTMRVAQLAGGAEVTTENARFFASPLPVLIHIPVVVVYSILGAFQFSASFRRRHRGWHRTAGKILIPCALLTAMTGLWMAHFYAWPAGDGYLLYLERLIVGTAMLGCIVLGVNAIRLRDFALHGDWMTRAYALAMGAATQVLTHLPWFILMSERPGEGPRAVMMGAAWVINALVAEWVIRRRRRATSARVASAGRVREPQFTAAL